MHTSIDIILPVHNPGKEFSACLRSCLLQNYPGAVRLILVDDGSHIPLRLDPFLEQRIEIKIIRSHKHRGKAFARNLGIEQSESELIVFQESSDMMHSLRLQRTHDAFHKDPFLMLLFGNVSLISDGEVQPIPRFRTPPKISSKDFLKDLPLYLSSVAVRRSALEVVGLFHEEFSALEDYELWMRLLEHFPLGIKYLSECMAYCNIGKTLPDETYFATLEALKSFKIGISKLE